MTKEEILEKSRRENKNGDEMAQKARDKSFAISASIGTLLCVVVASLEEIVFGRNAITIWIVYSGMLFSSSLAGAIQTKEKWLIGLSVVMTIVFISLVIIYVHINVGLVR